MTRIYKTLITDTLKVNTTFNSFVTDHKIIVPEYVTMTINDNAVIEFQKNAQLQIKGRLVVGNNAQIIFKNYSTLELQDLSLTNVSITFKDCARLKSANKLILKSKSTLTLLNNSAVNAGSIVLYDNCGINNNSVISTNKLIIYSCSGITNNNKMYIMKSLIDKSSSKIIISGSGGGQISCSNIDTLLLDNCSFDNVGLSVGIREQLENTYYSLKDIMFKSQGLQFAGKVENQLSLALSGLKFTNIATNQSTALSFHFINNLEINNVEINNSVQLANGINLEMIQNGFIQNLTINNCKKGISLIFSSSPGMLLSYASYNYVFDNVKIYNCSTGFNFGVTKFDNLKITNSFISNANIGLSIYNFTCSPQIENNIFTNCNNSAIQVSNGTNITIKNNNISLSNCGIILNNVTEPLIVNNKLTGNNSSNSLSGIISSSSDGIYRLNNISYFKNGIELGNSSPKIGQNTITGNIEHGLYVTAGSYPDLSSSYIYNAPSSTQIPISGFNLIKDNGNSSNCSTVLQSEIYFSKSKIALEEGCNSIIDDRDKPGCNNQILIEGYGGEDTQADLNYWGNHPTYGNYPTFRTAGDVTFYFDPYLTEPCINVPSQQNSLVLRNSSNESVDTVLATTRSNVELNGIKLDYAKGLTNYLNNSYTESIVKYRNIISANGTNIKSAEAYKKLFTIYKFKKAGRNEFSELKNLYEGKIHNTSDSVLIDILTHLSNLCLVEINNLEAAINNFLAIAENNPNNDKGLYAYIEALTVSLLMDTTNHLNTNCRLRVSGVEDFSQKYFEVLKNRSIKSLSSYFVNIPWKNILFSNYPNPFNPETVISFSIKTQTNVKLIIFDVLGRKVKELVNEEKQPGTYNIKFNAGNLSSGIYFYTLITNNFVQTKKMLLLK